MMMNSTIISYIIKPSINYINYTTVTSYHSNLLLNPLVHNKKSAYAVFRPLSCLKEEINIDNVFDTAHGNDDEDDEFTVAFDLIDLYTSALGRAVNDKTLWTLDPKDRVIPDYIPIKVQTYGVGSKFKLALGIESGMDMTETIVRDLVAMNFNHIVTIGAKPTLFLTPFSCPRKLREAVKDSRFGRCGFPISFSVIEKMQPGQIISSIGYGSIEGPAIHGENIKVGDVLIGLPSNGVHSHGFSLVRRVIEESGSSLKDILPGINITIGESLMTPTAIYVKEVLDIISKSKGGVNGIVYIDGGFTKTIRSLLVLKSGLGAVIYSDSWPVPPIFEWIQEVGKVEDVEMRRTLNMGIGMVLAINKKIASRVLEESCCKYAYRIGEVVRTDKKDDIMKIYFTCMNNFVDFKDVFAKFTI